MVKRTVLLFLVILLLGLSGCGRSGAGEKDSKDAAFMVVFIYQIDKIINKKIIRIQKKLKLNADQAEILYLLKSDLFAKIPEAREMVFELQMNMIDLLDKEQLTKYDVVQVMNEFDVYEKILKDTVVKRMIELHGKLNREQKEKLAEILDKGMLMYFPVRPINITSIRKYGIRLYRELALTGKQKRIFKEYGLDVAGHFSARKKELKRHGLKQKEQFRQMILSDTIDINEVDDIMKANIGLLDEFKEITGTALVKFHLTLSEKQKEVLVKYIAGFDQI